MSKLARVWVWLGVSCLLLTACESKRAVTLGTSPPPARAAVSVALIAKPSPPKPDPALDAAIAADRANEFKKLSLFLGFVRAARKAPDQVSGILECAEAPQPGASLCSKIYAEPGWSDTWLVSYSKARPSAFRVQAVFGNVELSCNDLGSSTVLRAWRFGSARKQHCAISTGPLAGLEAVVEGYPGNAKVLAFSQGYLQSDALFKAIVEAEGQPE
jgi:hypothetical protein